MGGENYKIQCLSTFLSKKLTTKPEKVDIEANFALWCLALTSDFVDVLVNYPSGKKRTQKDLLQNFQQSLI